MKATLRKVSWLILLALVLGAALEMGIASPVAAQQGQGGQQPSKPTQPGQPAQPPPGQPAPAEPAVPPVSKEEEDAFQAFFVVKNTEAENKVRLGEEFVKKFPESRYREAVYSQLTTLYLTTRQIDKMQVAGEKTLELNPDNVNVLSLLGWVLPRLHNPDALDADQKLVKAEKYAKRSIELAANLPKPPNLTEEEFTLAKNDMLSRSNSGLGVAYMHRQRYADAIVPLEQATQLITNPDPSDIYMLGLAYQSVGRHNDSVTAFGLCGEVAWDWQQRCKQNLEAAKKRAAAQPKP